MFWGMENQSEISKYVCSECSLKASDKDGRNLTFMNISMGGFRAEYIDTNEAYNNHTCYIDGIECYADEGRFGGIVIVAKTSNNNMS